MGEVKTHRQPVFTVRRITRIALLGAIAMFMSLTPFGYIQVAPGLRITFMHIPVIIAAITDGMAGGIAVGFIFGVSSLVSNLSTPFAPIFINPMVSVVPRIMIGVVSAWSYKRIKNVSITAALGTLTNTVLVLSAIYFIAGPMYADVRKIAFSALGKVLLGVAATNGTIEIIAGIILVTAIMKALDKVIKK